MEEFLSPKILSPLSSTLAAFCFTINAYLVWKRKDRSISGIFLFISWLFVPISFLFITLMLIWFYYFPAPLETFKIPIIIYFFFNFGQFFSCLAFLLIKIFREKLKGLIFAFLPLLFLPFLAPPFFKGKVVLNFGEPMIETGYVWQYVYFGVSVVILTIFLTFFLLWREIKEKKIFWQNLSSFYSYYAIIIYLAIVAIRMPLIYPYQFLIQTFYLLILYLNYLSYKEKNL